MKPLKRYAPPFFSRRLKIPNYEEGKEGVDWRDGLELAAGITPVIGTALDGYNLYNNPSLENAGYFGMSLLGDVLYLTGLGPSIKALNTTLKARKAIDIARRGARARSLARVNKAKQQVKTDMIKGLSPLKKEGAFDWTLNAIQQYRDQ